MSRTPQGRPSVNQGFCRIWVTEMRFLGSGSSMPWSSKIKSGSKLLGIWYSPLQILCKVALLLPFSCWQVFPDDITIAKVEQRRMLVLGEAQVIQAQKE